MWLCEQLSYWFSITPRRATCNYKPYTSTSPNKECRRKFKRHPAFLSICLCSDAVWEDKRCSRGFLACGKSFKYFILVDYRDLFRSKTSDKVYNLAVYAVLSINLSVFQRQTVYLCQCRLCVTKAFSTRKLNKASSPFNIKQFLTHIRRSACMKGDTGDSIKYCTIYSVERKFNILLLLCLSPA